MAKISLGQAALAFAGGAANEYNMQERASRKRAADMEDRMKDLQAQHQLKIAETRYSVEFADEMQERVALRAAKAAGGPNTAAGQNAYYIAKGIPESERKQLLMGGPGDFSGIGGGATAPSVPDKEPVGTATDTVIGRMNEVGSPTLARSGERMRPTMERIETEATRNVDDWGKQVGQLFPPEPVKLEFQKGEDGSVLGIHPHTGELVTRMHFPKPRGALELQPATGLFRAPDGKVVPMFRDTSGRMYDARNTSSPADMSTYEVYDSQVVSAPLLNADGSQDLVVTSVDKGQLGHGEQMVLGQSPGRTGGGSRGTPTYIVEAKQTIQGLLNVQSMLGDRIGRIRAQDVGIAGGWTNVVGGLRENVLGIAQLMGVDPITSDDQVGALISQMTANDENPERSAKEINQLLDEAVAASDKINAGMTRSEVLTIGYALAAVQKQVGQSRMTNVFDTKNAIQQVKMLSSSEGGLGAYMNIRHSVDMMIAMNYQTIYQDQEATPEDRAVSGYHLYKTTFPEFPEGRIEVDRQSGQVYIWHQEFDNKNWASMTEAEKLEAERRDLRQPLDWIIQKNNNTLRPAKQASRYLGHLYTEHLNKQQRR